MTADNDGTALSAMLVFDGHLFMVHAWLNDALVSRLCQAVHAVLDAVLRTLYIEQFGRHLYCNYDNNS